MARQASQRCVHTVLEENDGSPLPPPTTEQHFEDRRVFLSWYLPRGTRVVTSQCIKYYHEVNSLTNHIQFQKLPLKLHAVFIRTEWYQSLFHERIFKALVSFQQKQIHWILRPILGFEITFRRFAQDAFDVSKSE